MAAIISSETLVIEEIAFLAYQHQILELRERCRKEKDPNLFRKLFPAGMTDEHDVHAMHWGIFSETRSLIGYARMSVHREVSELPDRYLFADIWDMDLPAPIASLNRLSVASSYRGQGISAQMDRIRMAKAQRIGCASICGTAHGKRSQKLMEDGFLRHHSSMLSRIHGTDELTARRLPLNFYYKRLSQ